MTATVGYSGTPLPREVVLPSGIVDAKACAIDQTWSGLRFVRRKELR